MELSTILASSVLVGLVACGCYWSVVVGRVARTTRRVVHVKSGDTIAAPASGWPSVSVVVPMHNEERVVDRCLRSLRGQDHPALQIIVVLDRCTDGTEAIARRHAAEDARIVVVANDDCPPAWAGKCNAARLGADRATGKWILFTDADTRLAPNLIRAAQAIALRDDASLLSLLGRLTVERSFERLVQPVATITLMRLFPLERVSHPVTPRAFANGQFLLFRRADYDAVGGHHAVRDDLLEDLAFARLIQRSGRRIAVLLADELLEVSMYDTLTAFRAGWRRILIESCHRNVFRLRKNGFRIAAAGVCPPLLHVGAIVWLLAAVGFDAVEAPPAIVVATVIGLLWSIAAQATALQRIYSRLGVGVAWTLGYPIGALIVAAECFGGASDLAHGRPIRWGGRSYVITPRHEA